MFIAAVLLAPCAEGAAPYRGRPVDAALRELAAIGDLQLVYTDELIPAGVLVAREPSADEPLAAIADILAALGLELRRVDSRTYAILRLPAAPVAGASIRDRPASPAGLDEVVVTSSRYALASDVAEVHTLLTQSDLEALPRLAEDALKAVHRLPGAASNGLSGLAHLRGGEAGETLVLLDGLPLYEPFHLRLLQGPASVLDERIIEGLDAYAGGFTAEYGDRMSGIVDARSRLPDADAYYEAGLSLLHVNALASRSFSSGRGRWLAAVRRSNLDEVADALESDLGELTYVDGFGRVDYAWTAATRGSLHVLLARDDAQVDNPGATEHSDARYSNRYLWGTLAHEWSPRGSVATVFSYTDVAARRSSTVEEPGVRSGEVLDRRDYDVLGLRVDAKYASERALHRFGVDLRSLAAQYDYRGAVTYAPGVPFPGATSFARALAPSPEGEHVALYYTVRLQVAEPLTAELGLRWDEQTYGVDAHDQLGPRVNLAWRVDERTRVLANWGRHHQFPGIEELQVEDGVAAFPRTQRADHAGVALEREFGGAHSLRVEAYRKDYAQLRTRYENLYDPLSLAPELRWDRVAIAPESALAEGVELLVVLRPSEAWNGWASYAHARARDRLVGREVPRSWDQTHTLNAGIRGSVGRWQAALAGQYHTGWPLTAVELDSTGTVAVGPRNGRRYDHYASLDGRLSYEWPLSRGTLTGHLDVTNTLDRRNPCCVDVRVRDDGTLERELRHWLPLVPSIGVLWKF